LGTEHPLASADWSTVSAFQRLGLPVTPDESEDYCQQTEVMQAALRD
jgi:hypothetical protein